MFLPHPFKLLEDPSLLSHHSSEEGAPQWIYLVTAAALVLLGGAFAGLTIA
jgi:hypothetical protein